MVDMRSSISLSSWSASSLARAAVAPIAVATAALIWKAVVINSFSDSSDGVSIRRKRKRETYYCCKNEHHLMKLREAIIEIEIGIQVT